MPAMISLAAERLRLRALELRDVPGLIEGLNDWEIAQWLPTVPFPYTEADAYAFVTASAQSLPPQAYAVAALGTDELLGVVGLRAGEDAAELGYWLLRRHHVSGLMCEAVDCLIRHRRASVASIFSTVDPGNAPSIKLLEKTGFRLTGEHTRSTPNRQNHLVVLRYEFCGV